jgi:hypothetical protein
MALSEFSFVVGVANSSSLRTCNFILSYYIKSDVNATFLYTGFYHVHNCQHTKSIALFSWHLLLFSRSMMTTEYDVNCKL